MVRLLTGEAGLVAYLSRLVAMVVVGNTDAHLKNWALWYPDGRTPQLSPVYDFHSLTIYDRYRCAPLALSLAGERMPNLVESHHLARLAASSGGDPDQAVDTVRQTVERMQEAWFERLRGEARRRSKPLAEHYERRLRELPIVRA